MQSAALTERRPVPLGDPHNGGKRVCLEADGTIWKPRNVVWEWLILSPQSPLCEVLDRHQSLLPRLQFTPRNGSTLCHGGSVEYCTVIAADPTAFTLEIFEQVGRVIGLAVWFGISDLHLKNILWGMNREGQPVFAPLDIESLLHDYDLVTQSGLLASTAVLRGQCGLSDIDRFHREYPDPRRIAALCAGYLEALYFFQAVESRLQKILQEVTAFLDLPIRVLPRHTREYYAWLQGAVTDVNPPLCEAERMQLERGDIPYFVRFVRGPTLYYQSSGGQWCTANLPQFLRDRAMPRPRIFGAKMVTPRPIETLLSAGVLQLARYFDLAFGNVTVSYEHLQLQYHEDRIQLSHRDTLRVMCRRGPS